MGRRRGVYISAHEGICGRKVRNTWSDLGL